MADSNDSGAPAWPWSELPAYRADYRARCPIPDPASVIDDLAERRQWLVWRYEPGETENQKYRKMPHYASGKRRVGDQGSDEDRAALTDLATAAAAAGKRGFDGVGFAFLPGDGLIGIDLDGMIDPESGEISDRCSAIINACGSYTEYSPSGKGVHIFCAGETRTFKSNKVGVEVFCGRQFFTFTGKRWADSPDEILPIPEATLRRLKATVDAAKGRKANDEALPAQPHSPPSVPPRGGQQRSLAETVALAEEALTFLAPDDYEVWIDIGMACKAGLGSAGYLVWDAWSATSPKYAGEDDTRQRWRSFSPERISLGTLFSLAEEAGWVSPWAKAAERKRKRQQKSEPGPDYDYGTPPAGAEENHSHRFEAPAGGGDPPPPLDDGSLPEPPPEEDWVRHLVRKSGQVSPCLANAELILSHLPRWQGAIGFDEFAEKTMFRRALPCDPNGPASGEWSDQLDAMTAIWLQRSWRVEFSPSTVGQAVEVVARKNRFHPVREALEALPPWDGTRRNSEWLSDYLGVTRSEYTALVGQFFLRGMIKRVMEPGCKFDYCLVLEGEQGRGKSTAARILAWHWFADTDLDLSNKDALMALPGHWVYEISELGSLMKAEERKQKSFLSRQEDEYRPPYGKRLIKVPRQSVFIGTTNESEYLKDPTGGRRMWPVLCEGEINLDGLRSNLEQMFAEALADYRAKERCYPDSSEQKSLFSPEQAKRGMQEPIEDLLYQWVKLQTGPFSMAEAATDCLKLTADKLTPSLVTRLGISLRNLGCKRDDAGSQTPDPGRRRLYLPPAMIRSGTWGVETKREPNAPF